MDESTQDALRIAAKMINAGIPVFAAPPCPSGPLAVERARCGRPGHAGGGVEYDLPPKWQMTVPAAVWLERWQPGWALAAVGGHQADFLDEDPRNGGTESVEALKATGEFPLVFGAARTRSGGFHYMISPLDERKVVGLMPGLDYQGGAPDGRGRGFVWIAPTVGRSKADGQIRPYEWVQEPDLEYLSEFARGADGSSDGIRLRIAGWRARRDEDSARAQRAGGDTGGRAREFTFEQMRHFCSAVEDRLRTASIGEIEERANDLACTLSHFVPSLLSEEQAFDILTDALGDTAYDPEHPASQWEAGKFHDVLTGARGRAPGDWYAVPAASGNAGQGLSEAVAAIDVDGDEVSALLAEMLPPSVLAERRPPRYMIKGLLSYDSETWLIGGPGSKKSFVALDMAAHVARGEPWQGHKVNQGVALLIVGEGAGSIGKRIQAWQKEYGPMPDEGLRILPRPVQAKDPRAWAVLVKAVERVRAATDERLGMFIVVDTQARSTVGLDENSAEEMGVYVEALAALRSASGGCVMSVHHTTKAGGSTRGSGAQDGAQYSRLLMKSERGSLVSSLISDKQKDLEEAEPVELRFHKVDVGLDEDGEPVNSLVLTARDAWADGVFGQDSLSALDHESARVVTPFSVRSEPENWTHKITYQSARVQRWLLQALKDTAVERGLTQAEWRRLVEEKIGKVAAHNWARAFQVVTDSSGQAGEVVRKVHGADRWTVDPMAVQALEAATE